MATMSISNRNRPRSEDGYLYFVGINYDTMTAAAIRLRDDYSDCEAEKDGVVYKLLGVCMPGTSESLAKDYAMDAAKGHIAARNYVDSWDLAYYTVRRGETIRIR